MRERPILFSGDMVRAILDGRKTMTRRVMRDQPSNEFSPSFAETYAPAKYDRTGEMFPGNDVFGVYDVNGRDEGYICPYGKVGDQLWVKETWHVADRDFDPGRVRVEYAASYDRDNPDSAYYTRSWSPWIEVGNEYATKWKDVIPKSWCSPIFMPRWASRITLEITDVRVERLQDILANDAIAEGVDLSPMWETDGVDYEEVSKVWTQNVPRDDDESLDHSYNAHYIACFKRAWNKINGKKHPWESNPFVWVISFKKI